MGPDQQTFEEHRMLAQFQWGESQGWWTVLAVQWPLVFIEVQATRQDTNIQESIVFRFDLSNYPAAAPTACPVDAESKQPLPPGRWPAGGEVIESAFNPGWNATALYLPCDRIAMAGHEPWQNAHPDLWWTPQKTIDLYLTELHELLNHRDYRGPKG